jgi:hypothetical protein
MLMVNDKGSRMAVAISAGLRELWDQRAHLKIQLSLMGDRAPNDHAALLALHEQMARLNDQIRSQKSCDAADQEAASRRRG